MEKTVVQRGRCDFDTDGNMTIDGVVYSHSSADDASAAASNAAFQQAFDDAVADLPDLPDDCRPSAPFSGRFSVEHRRHHTHINSFNPVIQFAIRSNMDIKALLKGNDSKGLMFYILNYATKTEQTLDVLLPLLVPVVERLLADSEGESQKEIAVRLVHACLCKQLSSLAIGGAAAISKIMGWPDHWLSHATVRCPMAPLLAWASSRDKPADADDSDGSSDSDSDRGAESDGDGVIITPVGGKLTVAQRTHILYRCRCDPDDESHPFWDMCYVVWCRLVRIERRKSPASKKKGNKCRGKKSPVEVASDTDKSSGGDSGSEGDDDGSGDDCADEDAISRSGRTTSTTPAKKTGKVPAIRYSLAGDVGDKWVQVSNCLSALYRLHRFLCTYVHGLFRRFIAFNCANYNALYYF